MEGTRLPAPPECEDCLSCADHCSRLGNFVKSKRRMLGPLVSEALAPIICLRPEDDILQYNNLEYNL